ncbi:histidine phosphatase family protein [Bacillus tianshenii]|nr:histidine phosphatase family protein [Bacillus tianshenii]
MDGRVAVTLIRHGVTEANLAKQYLGWRDEPLSVHAEDDLQVMKELFVQPDCLLSSDLNRCVATAKFLFPHLPLKTTRSLREFNFGDWEGKTYAELKEQPAYCAWLDDDRLPVPNGETKAVFHDRIRRSITEIAEEMDGMNATSIAVVTHGGVIRTLLEWFAPTQKSFWQWNVPHAGGWLLETTSERLRRGERCISLQEVSVKERKNG